MRACVSYVGKESAGQLTLDIKIVLFYVSIFGIEIRRKCGIAVRGYKCRQIRRRIPSRWQQDTRVTEGAGLSTGKAGKVCSREGARISIQRGERRCVRVVRGCERRAGQVDYVVIGVERERDIVRDEEDAVASSKNRLLIHRIGETNPGREFFFV